MIPVKQPLPSKFEDLRKPGPIADSRFTEAEKAKITAPSSAVLLKQSMEKFAPGWTIAKCGQDMDPGLKEEALGRKNVLLTHPLDKGTACVLSKSVDIPAGKKTTLRLVVGHHPMGNWDLIVRADGKQLLRKAIGKETAVNGWTDVDVDLSPFAGKTVAIELVNQPTDWAFEAGYWATIEIESL